LKITYNNETKQKIKKTEIEAKNSCFKYREKYEGKEIIGIVFIFIQLKLFKYAHTHM
jgi:hypothetical protein